MKGSGFFHPRYVSLSFSRILDVQMIINFSLGFILGLGIRMDGYRGQHLALSIQNFKL